MAKANADYEKLHRYAVADLVHYEQRVHGMRSKLENMLANVPERAAVMQLVEHFAVDIANRANAAGDVERYERLLAKRDNPSNGQESAPEPQSESEPEQDAPASGTGRRSRAAG